MDNLAYNDDNRRYELINGETVMLARPAINHGDVVGNIHMIFKKYLRGKRCRTYIEPDVYLDEDNHFVPDLVIVCNKDIIKRTAIHGAPDLVVEVLSPRTAKNDRSTKKDIYEKYGVKEYWLVSPSDKSIEVYHLVENKFVLDNIYHVYEDWEWDSLTDEEKAQETLSLKVSLYDDMIIDIRDVFDDMMEWDS